MSEVKSANAIARERVEDLSTRSAEPGWLRESRLTAWEAYLQSPMPTTRDEEWKHTDLSKLDLLALPTLDCGNLTDSAGTMPERNRKSLEQIGETSGIIYQETQAPGYRCLSKELEDKGVIFTDVRSAIEKHPELIRKYFSSTGPETQNKFERMNRALFNCGLVLYVPANLEISAPFASAISLNTAGALFPRILVIAGANSRFNLIQVFDSHDRSATAAALASAITEVYLGDGAVVNYVELNNFGYNVALIAKTQNEVERDARFGSLSVAIGGQQTKQDIATLLQAPGASSEVLGVVLGSGTEHFNFNTIQEHNATDTTSDINFRVALKDSASSTYQGTIRVDKVAQRTNAFQSNKNLLLGNEARSDSIPKLEILADDVKCSHGATVGPVDHEQVFYLMSRGMPLAQAEQLIVLGFFRQVLERFQLANVSEWLSDVVSRKIFSDAAVLTRAKMSVTNDYVKVARLSEIPEGTVKVVEADGHKVALCNSGGDICAVADLCSHDNGPLGQGELMDGEIECPRHGARFDIHTGKPTCLPAVMPIPTYPVQVRGEEIWIGTAPEIKAK